MSEDFDLPKLPFEESEWTFPKLLAVHKAMVEIVGERLDPPQPQIEIITADQMLDSYASIGLPKMYPHWSFGKRYIQSAIPYRKGIRGLALEIVINSDPALVYCMEENTMAAQTLVIAHAGFGHGHFFKHNQLFKQWTDPKGIEGYIIFAADYIRKCEVEYGVEAVEAILDSAHALMPHGVDRFKRKAKLNLAAERKVEAERKAYEESQFNDLWRTLPEQAKPKPLSEKEKEMEAIRKKLGLPEENLLYFLEKQSQKLQPWQKEILRIVRILAQYFYPQKQTKLMNEGCATFVHHWMMHKLHEHGLITDGAMIEMMKLHTNVIAQPPFDDCRYPGVNPYAIGFAMMRDIKRICLNPEPEDKNWFPDFAGNSNYWEVLRFAWAEFRDESFIRQFLSPKIIRDFRMFAITDDAKEKNLLVSAIHEGDNDGYREIRRVFAAQNDLTSYEPDIQIVDTNPLENRSLRLRHNVRNGVILDKADTEETAKHLANLWGYPVILEEGSFDESGNFVKTGNDFKEKPD